MTRVRQHAINLISLTAIQGSNAVLPLIVFPFALGVVGADHYQQIVQGEAISLLLLSIVLYSFEVTGVAAVVGLDPKRATDQIAYQFSLVTYLRLLLFAVSAPIVLLVVYFFNADMVVLTATWMLMPLSFAISPNWLYLGLQRNLMLAATTILSRLIALAAVFATVRGANDYIYIPLSIGLSYLFGALAAAGIAMSVFGARLVRVKQQELWLALVTGRDIFLANLGVTLYRDLNVLLMGVLGASSVSIASYSVAEKFTKALQATVRPLNQFFFPTALALAKKAEAPSSSLFMSLSRILIPLLLVLAALMVVLGLIYVEFGRELPLLDRLENRSRIVLLAGIMSAAIGFGVANNLFGTAGLNALGLSRFLLIAIVVTGVTSLAVASLLILLLSDVGAAISFIFGEIFLFCLITWKFFSNRKKQTRDNIGT